MSNTRFLKDFPLQLSIEKKDLETFRELLRVANESHIIIFAEDKISDDITNFYINIPTTSFANGYWYIGFLYYKMIRTK